MNNFETPAQKTIRLSKEKKILDYHTSGDSNQSDRELDTYKYGALRSDISLEQARHAARSAIKRANQDTDEFPAVAA